MPAMPPAFHTAMMVPDRNWVSSRQPSDIPAFNRGIAELFTQAVSKKAA
jgi:hypothetical protein